MLETFIAEIEASRLAAFMGASTWAYLVANLVHLLGLVLLVGCIGIVDLRLFGLFRSLPLKPLMRALTPLAIGGFVLAALTGTLLFVADAATLSQSATLGWKLALIALAALNMVVFHWGRRGNSGEPTTLERLLAIVSITLWLTVAALGRLIAYT